jgi:protein-tyrosine phosphatase
VCTGNICRSPMAEGLLRHRLSGVDARVHSAGLLFDDHPASEHAVDVLADVGVDIAPHRSRQLLAEFVEDADVVLGMTREHVREAVVLVPNALAKTFTLKELVRRGERVGPRRDAEPLADWLGRAGAGRKRTDVLGSSAHDDVADPIGMSRVFYEQTRAELSDLVDRLARLVSAAEAPPASERESA